MPAAPTWNHKYTVRWTNENNEFCEVRLKGKTATGDVEILQASEVPFEINSPNSDEDKFSPIRGKEAVLRILIQDGDTVGLSTFLGADDEWKLDYYKSDLVTTNWQGFLVQEEHTREMQDPPYELELRAVDGIGWLKDKALVNEDGENYTGLNFIIDYIGSILWQLNPELKLVTHVNVFNIAMDDRDISPEKDPWAQAKLQARGFMDSATSFYNQYRVLEETLISWGCVLYQWFGAWHIVDLWDIMNGSTSYTVYKYDLVSPTDAHVRIIDDAQINKVFEAKIAPADSSLWPGEVFPVHEDQRIGLKFANKSVKTIFNYVPWPELPLNNKFERGTFLPLLSDSTHQAFTIDAWTSGHVTGLSPFPFTPFTGPAVATHYSYRTFDGFGVEISREVIMPNRVAGTGESDGLLSEGIPVTAGDKITISFSWKFNIPWSPLITPIPVFAYVLSDDGVNWYGLEERPSTNLKGAWQHNALGGIWAEGTDGDFTKYNAFTSESQPIPINGTLYIMFSAPNTSDAGQNSYFNDFRFEYMPYAGGGYAQIEGEYNLVAQNQELKQTETVEIFQSDSTHAVLKGTIYRFTNVPTDHYVPSNPVWYRYGHSAESRRFGELQALKRFWHTYIARQKIEGSFSGLIFFPEAEAPIGNITIFNPEYLGDGKKYMLTNLEEDHKTAEWKATMIETGTEADATEPDTNIFKFIFK